MKYAIRLGFLFIFAFVCLQTPEIYRRCVSPFRATKCNLNWPYVPEWDTKPLEISEQNEVLAILKQPFSYLERGKQSYAFLSEDGKYVLKLFRFDTCPFSYGKKCRTKLRQWRGHRKREDPLALQVRAKLTFDSCKMAFELIKDLTQLKFVHLNPKPSNLPILQLQDRLGRTHYIDPSIYRFVLQKKAELFSTKILTVTNHQRQKLISSYFSLVERLSKSGLANLDHAVARNFAFLNGEAVVIDVGNFSFDPKQAERDPKIFFELAHSWFKKQLPEEMNYIDQFKPKAY